MEYKLKKLGSIKKIKLPEQKFTGRDMDAKNEHYISLENFWLH